MNMQNKLIFFISPRKTLFISNKNCTFATEYEENRYSYSIAEFTIVYVANDTGESR